MATIDQVAQAFAAGRSLKGAKCRTDGSGYTYYNTVIAVKNDKGGVTLNWGGYYTTSTANHMNKVLKAMGYNQRVSYAQARDSGATLVQIN